MGKKKRGSRLKGGLLALCMLVGLYGGWKASQATWPTTSYGATVPTCHAAVCAPRVAKDAGTNAQDEEDEEEADEAPAELGRWRLVGPLRPMQYLQLQAWLKAHLDAKHKTAIMEIDSPGGSVVLAHEISKLLEGAAEKGLKVQCVVDGMALSAGFAILQSCPDRAITRRSYLMAHSPYQPGTELRLETLDNEKSSLEAIVRAFAEQCSHRLKVTIEEYLKRTTGGREWWMDWREAEKVGAVDRVVASVLDLPPAA